MLLLLLLACTGDNKVDGDGAWCEDVPTAVALDEVTELGFSGAELWALAAGERTAPLTWARGGEAVLTLGVTGEPAEARFVDSVPHTEDGGSTIGIECTDRVEVDADVRFVTDDGAFDEAWALPLSATEASLVSFHRRLDLDALGGSYDPAADIEAAVGDEPYESVSVDVRGELDAAGTRGAVAGQVDGEEQCEDDGTCSDWAAELPVATWGEGEEG